MCNPGRRPGREISLGGDLVFALDPAQAADHGGVPAQNPVRLESAFVLAVVVVDGNDRVEDVVEIFSDDQTLGNGDRITEWRQIPDTDFPADTAEIRCGRKHLFARLFLRRGTHEQVPAARDQGVETEYIVLGGTQVAPGNAESILERDELFEVAGTERTAQPRTELPEPRATIVERIKIQLRKIAVTGSCFCNVELKTLLRI
jgi:hypothetical protein